VGANWGSASSTACWITFSEADAKYLKGLGCTVVRLPLNYRHFEADSIRSIT
jgi:hypothetical protein